MTDEHFYLWVASRSTFITITVILVLVHGLLSLLAIRKLLAVRKEPEHPVKYIKVIFWYMIVSINIISTFQKTFGWSGRFTNFCRLRYLDEGLEVVFRFLFTAILLTIIFIVQAVIQMAKGDGTTNTDENRYYSALATIVPLSVLRSSMAAYRFYGSMNGGLLKHDINNNEKAKKLIIKAVSENFYDVVIPIYDAYKIYEFIIRMMLIVVSGFVLWEVGQLMSTQNSLKSIRKYKLKEWAIFLICCAFISCIGLYRALGNIKDGRKTKRLWHLLIYSSPTQKRPEYIPLGSFLIGKGDIIGIVIGLLTTLILTLLTPCRNVVKGK